MSFGEVRCPIRFVEFNTNRPESNASEATSLARHVRRAILFDLSFQLVAAASVADCDVISAKKPKY